MTLVCVVPPLPLLALSLAFEGPAEIGDALAGPDARGIGAVLYLAFAATTRRLGAVGVPDGRLPGRRRSRRSRCSCPVFGLAFGALLLGEPVTGRATWPPRCSSSAACCSRCGPRAAISPLFAELPPGEACIPAGAGKVRPDAEVRDAESEATEVRGPPP